MKKILLTSVALAVLAGCTAVDNPEAVKLSANSMAKADGAKTPDFSKAKKDDRGHPARPMSQSRLDELMGTYDANGDGELLWAEYNDWRRARFDETDSNNNGTVDTEEYVYEFEGRLDDRYEEARAKQVEQTKVRFNALDKNESRFIEWAEYEASGDRIFAHWDSNKDGVLDSNDEGASQKVKRRFRTIGMPTTHSWKGVMTIYDGNEDGKIERDDFVNSRRSEFHLADQDKNGKVNLDEYMAEFEDRLDTQIANRRRGAIKQTYVRFNALDDNRDKIMTFAEFQISGMRIFTRWDKNQDGVINAADVNEK